MSLSNFNRLTIEYITLDAATPLLIILLGFIQIFVCAILGWDYKIYGYLLGPKSSSSSSIQKEQSINQKSKEKKTVDNDKMVCLHRGDMEIVFQSLGLFSFSAKPESQEILDSEFVSKLFDDNTAVVKEEELKAAFDVFDENKDGFIDEFELQRVLRALGFKQGLEIDNCRKMILLADNNGDGRLDFTEFVNFLQNSS